MHQGPGLCHGVSGERFRALLDLRGGLAAIITQTRSTTAQLHPCPRLGLDSPYPCPGNAYALLAVWRATGDPVWLQRAQCFAAFICERGGGRDDWGRPDHPFSLFEGLGGALCLLSDLAVDPEGARFPFYEV